jgi:putative endonuclease
VPVRLGDTKASFCTTLGSVVIARGETPKQSQITFMQPTVYILFNHPYGTLYTGVTSNLKKRIAEHKERLTGFTAKYNVTKLGYCEYFQDIRDAIAREKQLKAGCRKKKIELITSINPTWKDLAEGL